MSTQLLIVILSIVSLVGAALLGGGLASGVLWLFGRRAPRLEPRDSAPVDPRKKRFV